MSSEVEPILHQCPNCSVMLDVSEQEPFSEIRCPNCDVSMRVRRQFNNFELVEAIASGGMGTVYKARDIHLNRIVALKLLRKEFSADQDYIEKLETEAKITASVNHPHVVKVFSFGSDYGQYYIAMELVDKGSLDDLMNLQGRIAEVQVLEIGIQAAMGTPYYVAPEKLNHEPEDFRSDIYSLGGTLFHALAGRPPFEAENASLVALKHLKSQAVSLQAFAPDISSPTSYVINRTLAKNPDERYQSYDELIEHLEYARTQLLENSGKPRQEKVRVVVEGAEQQQVVGYINFAIIAFVVVLGVLLFIFRDNIMSRRLSVRELEERRIEKGMGPVESAYSDARKRLLAGDTQKALDSLKELSKRPNVAQPLKNWVLLMKGIAFYIAGSEGDGRRAFDDLKSEGTFSYREEDSKLASFFVATGRMMADKKPTDSTAAMGFKTDEFESLGLLAVALKNWDGGHFGDAASLFQAFIASEPRSPWRWIADFKPLAKRYLGDYDLFSPLSEKIKDASTAEQKTALIPQIEDLKTKLRLPGKLPERLDYYEQSFKFGSSSNSSSSSSSDSNFASITRGWTSRDIGITEHSGRTDYSGGRFKVEAAGNDIGADADNFRFVCQQMSGNGSIVTRIMSADNTDESSKAGIMIRESMDRDSRAATLVSEPARGIKWITRNKVGASCVFGGSAEMKLPCWLKVVRSGSEFTAFVSSNGAEWKAVGGTVLVSMSSTTYAGLAVCSRKKDTLKAATFENVSVSSSGAP